MDAVFAGGDVVMGQFVRDEPAPERRIVAWISTAALGLSRSFWATTHPHQSEVNQPRGARCTQTGHAACRSTFTKIVLYLHWWSTFVGLSQNTR